jgi:hypothetical protein
VLELQVEFFFLLLMAVRYTRAAHTVRANEITLPENFDMLDPDFDDCEKILTSATNSSRMAANNIVTPEGPEAASHSSLLARAASLDRVAHSRPHFSHARGTRDLEQRKCYYSASSSPACIDLLGQRG